MSQTRRAESGMNQKPIRAREVTAAHVRPCVFAPRPDDHKYRRGTVLFATGSERFPGAALLGVDAAARSGVGMVRYLGPASLAQELVRACPEAVIESPAGRGMGAQPDAIVVGSGIPDVRDDQRVRAARRALTGQTPREGDRIGACIVDAGALGLVADLTSRGERLHRVLLTPHAAELARMLGELRGSACTAGEVEADRAHAARQLAARTGATVLLKGYETLIVEPGGEAQRVIAPSSWLATAGAGDVLAGIAGALAATAARRDEQERPQLAAIAAAAAWLHGRAAWLAAMRPLGEARAHDVLLPHGELAKRGPGGPITARDIARELPAVLAALLTGPEAAR